VGEDIGHYRIVRGYDVGAGQLLTQDSFLGPNLWLTTGDFEAMWQPFFFAYAPLYREEQEPLVAAIIGPDWDDEAMIARALGRAQADADGASENPYAWYNLGDARRLAGDPQGALSAYERAVEIGLPGRFFWYQSGFFAVLNDLGQHQRLLELTEPLVEEVPSLAELRVERGRALRSLGRKEEARAEFEEALLYLSEQDQVLAILADLQ
jgi:tetratricopeptide (TPR) repeat protein